MRKIVVTGALGHLGSKLVEHLATSPVSEIVAIDDLSSGRIDAVSWQSAAPRVSLVQGDVLSLDLEQVFDRADVVFHLAALTDSTVTDGQASRMYHVNVDGTRRVADACARSRSVLVYPSTTSVYAAPPGTVPEDDADRWIGPSTPYADSKDRAERILHDAARESGLRYTVIRFGTIFGVSRGMHFRTAVQKFCREAALTGRVSVWASAVHQVRPYCDIDDAVRAMVFVSRDRTLSGATVHAASEHATVRRVMDYLTEVFPRLRVDTVSHQAMNDWSYEVSCSRLTRRGFVFAGSLRRGIENLISCLSSATLVS